jgi:hypothetical protein
METETRHSWKKGEPAMTPSVRIRFFVVAALATSTQSAFAGGKMMGGGGGNFSRPAFKPPVVVNRSLPTHNLQTVSPSYVVKNGNSNGVVRSNVLPSAGTTNNNVQALCHHHDSDNSNVVPANPTQGTQDANRVPRNSNRVPRDLTNSIPKPNPSLPVDSTNTPIISRPIRPETPETQDSIGPGHPVSQVTGGTEQHILAERPHIGDNDVVSATNPNPLRDQQLDNRSNSGPAVFNAPTRIQVDPNLFRNIRPNIGSIGSQPGGGSSTHNTITVPPGANKHINPLPGEHPIVVRPPAPGIRIPVNGPVGSGSSNIGIFLGQISSLLPGSGDSGAVAGGVEEVVPVETSPAPAASPVSSAPATVAEAQTKDALDVELTDVRLVDAGSLERNIGPRFRLYYRNAGNVETPKFHVSVAVDIGERVTEKAELVTVEAVGVKPGKTQTVDVRLPVEVLKMAIDYEGRPTAFNAFVALIDSDNDLAESNETNNLLVISRAKILPVE